MNNAEAFREACATVTAAATAAGGADLTHATPCRDFDLRALVNHFVGTSAAMGRVGRHEALDPDDPWGMKTEVADGDWAGQLGENLAAVAAAWSAPEAWDGTVNAGTMEMPAAMVGNMALVEVLVHGWDLAAATGQELAVSADLATSLLERVQAMADQGRQMGAFGPEVSVPDDASDLDRAVALSGRDPNWGPGTTERAS